MLLTIFVTCRWKSFLSVSLFAFFVHPFRSTCTEIRGKNPRKKITFRNLNQIFEIFVSFEVSGIFWADFQGFSILLTKKSPKDWDFWAHFCVCGQNRKSGCTPQLGLYGLDPQLYFFILIIFGLIISSVEWLKPKELTLDPPRPLHGF